MWQHCRCYATSLSIMWQRWQSCDSTVNDWIMLNLKRKEIGLNVK
jgi:hypothetical protein